MKSGSENVTLILCYKDLKHGGYIICTAQAIEKDLMKFGSAAPSGEYYHLPGVAR
jgi:hypothetical protein